MSPQLTQSLRQIQPDFSDGELAQGLAFFERKLFKAKELVLSAGKVSNDLFFAVSSVTRCFYTDDEGKEHTLWMKPAQTFITEYKSFVSQEKSGFSLQFYEDTELFSISRTNLMELYQVSNTWALFGIQLTEQLHVTLIDVFVNLLANDATQNYNYIAYMFPQFLRVAPLKDIASMLQISPVSLSRIRAGTQTKY